jgi:HrpA-like RNA helicase/predicted RNA-binding protein with RPS1 domain
MAQEWTAKCKDCGKAFGYSNASFQADTTRGLSAPERCPACRGRHSKEIRTVGLSHFHLKPIGKLPPGLVLPPGRLGKIHHDLPPHRLNTVPSNFEKFRFGITELDILRVFASLGARFEITPKIQTLLAEEQSRLAIETGERKDNTLQFKNNQVIVIEGPTGSGKSTLLPYRLMVPPPEVNDPLFFTRRGQIIVTQPRVQATRGIPKFVAEQLHGSSLGPGFDVGFKHHNAAETDRRNQLVFVTDGTLINWIINEQLGNFSLVMIDEAHERSLNIDLILGLLKTRLQRYPHLKLVIASATIAADEFIQYFGGPEKVGHLAFGGISKPVEDHFSPQLVLDYDQLLQKPARAIDEVVAKAIADKVLDLLNEIVHGGSSYEGDILVFLHSENSIDLASELIRARVQKDHRFSGTDVFRLYRSLPQTEQDRVLMNKAQVIGGKIIHFIRQKRKEKGGEVGPMLALVLDARTANGVIDVIRETGEKDRDHELSELPIDVAHEELNPEQLQQMKAKLANTMVPYLLIATYKVQAGIHFSISRGKVFEDRRVIISTNVAETSLTVDGVVYVVDSGIIKQTTWDPKTLTQRLASKTHSQAGCRQRRGRAGRIRAGHAYYLYTKDQFEHFEEHTQPEIKRAPLEAVVLSAKAAGVSNIATFPWFQRNPEMDVELQRSQTALQVRHILDPDGDITEQGLELRSLALDTQSANFLMNADRFACALEAATLIPMILMQKSLLGGLLLWDQNWDAATRWEVKKRHYGLCGGCTDDLDLCMKVFAGWEAAGKIDSSREAWARSFMVNHEMLANYILPERSALLDHLSIATKGESLRPVDFDLLDRIRMVFAYSFPDQVGSTSQFSLSSESVCYGQEIQSMAYGRRIPFRTSVEGQPDFRVSLVVRLDSGWGNLGQLNPLQLGRLISKITRDERGGVLYRSPLWDQTALLEAPVGAKFACRILGEAPNNVRLVRRIQEPKDIYLRPTGIYIYEEEADEELEIEGAVRSQGRGKRYINYEAPEEELEAEPLIEETPKLRLLCLPPPDEWKSVDVYIDGELEVKELSLAQQSTVYFDASSGSHSMAITPSGQELQGTRTVKVQQQDLQDDGYYSILLGPWQEAGLPRVRSLQDDHQMFGLESAQIRWTTGGRFEKVDVFLNRGFLRAGSYRLVDSRRPSWLEVYRRGGRDRNEQPLVKEKMNPQDGSSWTIFLFADPENAGIKYEVVNEAGLTARSTSPISRLDMVATKIPEWYSLPSGMDTLETTVIGYRFVSGKHPVAYLLPAHGRGSFFESFMEQFRRGSSVDGKPVTVDVYPERRRAALIVQEQKTHLEIAVDGEELLFCDHPSETALKRLLDLETLPLIVDDVDPVHERVYLTRLPLLDAGLSAFLGEERKVTANGVVAEVVLEGPRPGIVLVFPLDTFPGISVFMHSDRVAQGSPKPLAEFQVGDPVKAQLNFIGGKVKIAGWSEEIQESLTEDLPAELRVIREEGEFIFAMDRPMRYAELEKLIRLHPSRGFKEAVRALYRNSNLPQVDILDAQRLAKIDQRYAPGVIIEGCLVNRILKDSVELKIEPNILGGVHISEWSTERTEDLDQVTKVGDLVDVMVLRREDNGFLRLSKRRAAVWQYQENTRYYGEVISVDSNGAEIRLISTGNNQPIHQPVTGYARKNQIRFLQKDEEFDPTQVLRVGQRVLTRVLEIDSERGRIQLTLCRAYEVILDVPASANWGWIFMEHHKNRKNIELATGTTIFVDRDKNDRNRPGKITVWGIASGDVQSAVSALRARMSGMQEKRPVALVAKPARIRATPQETPTPSTRTTKKPSSSRRSTSPQLPTKKPAAPHRATSPRSTTETFRRSGAQKAGSKGCLAALWDWLKELFGL